MNQGMDGHRAEAFGGVDAASDAVSAMTFVDEHTTAEVWRIRQNCTGAESTAIT
jgi:hypothetical protein